MKKMFGILFLLAFAIGGVFLACTDNGENPDENSSSSVVRSSSSNNSNNSVASSSSAAVSNPVSSSSSIASSSPAASSSSSAAAGTSSSTVAVAPSSSSKASSSSVAKSPCVEPMNGVPPGGITSCIIVNGKCYTCNPERGNDCTQAWIWNGGNASGDTYWYKEVSCNGSIAPGTSSGSGTSSNSSGGGTSSNSSGGGGTPSYVPSTPGNETSKVTHYWDACKPSCAWSTNFGGGKQANACNISGSNIGHNDMDKSACDGGSAFMCMNQAPWKVGNVSFGYVAAAVGKCGDCYQFDFPNGQVMVVMANNHGNIHEGAKFDLMVPGGGVGDFDALTRQVNANASQMGERYGGFRGACGWSYSATAANCVKQKCESVFANFPDLKAGCLWYVNTLGTDEASWNNPTVKYKQVTCPSELTSKY